MKQILAVFILVALAVGSSFGQSRFLYSSYTSATTTWDSVAFPTDVTHLYVKNDAASGTDTLFVAFGNDTVSTRRIPIKQGEGFYLDGVQPKGYIRTKSSAGTIPRRVWGY